MKYNGNIFEAIRNVQRTGRTAALVTVVETKGSTPRDAGAKMIVFEDGSIIDTIGGGVVEQYIITEAKKVIKSNTPKLLHYSLDDNKDGIETGMICGGDMKVFIEPIKNSPSLYIFGAGHIGKHLYSIGIINNFNINIYDVKKESVDFEFYSNANHIETGQYKDVIPAIEFASPAFVVIATKSHYTDEVVLRELLKSEHKFKYIGMVASKKKFTTIKEHLLESGMDKEKLEKVKSPVGLPINSESPAEIAVSIFAEIILEKNKKKVDI